MCNYRKGYLKFSILISIFCVLFSDLLRRCWLRIREYFFSARKLSYPADIISTKNYWLIRLLSEVKSVKLKQWCQHQKRASQVSQGFLSKPFVIRLVNRIVNFYVKFLRKVFLLLSSSTTSECLKDWKKLHGFPNRTMEKAIKVKNLISIKWKNNDSNMLKLVQQVTYALQCLR